MFWTDWGNEAKIEKCQMDGSNRKTIVSGSDVGWPNGLTIDYGTSTLYWMDARLDHMMKANFDGSEKLKVLENLRHPFGLDINNGYAYWSDWHDMAIYRINMSRMASENKERLLSNVGGLMEIRTYRSGHVSSKNSSQRPKTFYYA